MTGSWIFCESLSCVWCCSFMLPKLTSLGLRQEALWLLTDKDSIWIISCVILSHFLNWNNGFVCSRAWWKWSFFLVFAIWHFRLEHLVLSTWVKLLLSSFLIVIDTRAWILWPTHIVVCVVCLFEKLSFDFTSSEIIFWESWMNCWHFWVVSSWTDLIKTYTSICSLRQFFRWNTWSLCCWYNS